VQLFTIISGHGGAGGWREVASNLKIRQYILEKSTKNGLKMTFVYF
jgi:hypothetical protein